MKHKAPPSLALLAVISGISSFSLAIIVPAIPSLSLQLDTDAAGAQFLVSAYLLGLAVSQPIWGQVADRIGRRPVALAGFAIFTLASFASMYADTLESLSALRVLQAAGCSTGATVSRAVVRDLYSAEDATRAMSWIAMGLGAAPIIAPMIGGALLVTGSSDGLFLVMGFAGVLLWILMYFRLQETLPKTVQSATWGNVLSAYSELLRCRAFLGFTAVYGLIQGGFFAFLAVGAAVFIDSFELSPAVFGSVWGIMGFAYVLGALLGGRLSSTARRPLLLPLCVCLNLALALIVIGLDLVIGARALTVLIPMFLMMVLSGCSNPLAMAGAVYQKPKLAGTAAGLSSALGMTVSGLFTVAAGVIYAGDFTPIAALMALSAGLTFLAWWVIRRD